MIKKVLIVIVILIVLVLFGFWAKKQLLSQDLGIQWISSDDTESVIPDELLGRRLAWVSNANVPLKIEWGGEGYDLLGLLGIPEKFQPFHYAIGRTPIRDEWNAVQFTINGEGDMSEPNFLTEDIGIFLNLKQVTPGGPMVATHQVGDDQDIVIIYQGGINAVMTVSESPSLDRWPSVNNLENEIVFQSYRDGNPGGDLYFAESPSAFHWDTYRLTDNPNVEYILPMIDPEGNLVVAIERELMAEDGRVILWEIDNRQLTNGRYLTMQSERISQPSISENGEVVCWEKRVDDRFYVCVWTNENGERVLGPQVAESTLDHGWEQPSVSPDGLFVTFIDSVTSPGEYRLAIYNLETDEIIWFEGCGGYFMFPCISSPAR
jgi:hypothetical protein